MAGTKFGADRVPRSVGAAAEAALGARGDAQRLGVIFEYTPVPMLLVDSHRRYAEVNSPARLAFRLSLDEMRRYTVDDLSPPDLRGVMEESWARLLETGHDAGRSQLAGRDGSRLDVVYRGLANVLPGLHLGAFVPADWPEDELASAMSHRDDPSASLTPREIDVLALAADGFSGPELARELVLSRSTINTHFKNIYVKLDVRSRAAAVAKAIRLGVIC
jgi:DNA-binding CsgD family transcriptional regulator